MLPIKVSVLSLDESVLQQPVLPLDDSVLQQPVLSFPIFHPMLPLVISVLQQTVVPIRVFPTPACAMLPVDISILQHSELSLAAGLVCVYFLQPLLSMGMSGLQQLVLHLDIYVQEVSDYAKNVLSSAVFAAPVHLDLHICLHELL